MFLMLSERDAQFAAEVPALIAENPAPVYSRGNPRLPQHVLLAEC
jgi:hypothetical protein